MKSTVIDGRRAAPGRRRRAATAVGITTAIAAIAASMLVGAVGSSAAVPAVPAVPVFPDNIAVFPNRDFVTIEGYQDHIDDTGTVTVTRPGIGVVGSAKGKVAEGDVAFEVNHPGGYCWGAGTGLNITPDILPGDVVSISFDGVNAGETTVQDAFVDTDSKLNGSTLTVTGHIGAGVIQTNTEARIIEPALRDTAVGKRDIRAIPGPLTPAPRGGYSSSLEFAGQTFTATYVFDDPTVAEIAANAGLGERLMSWQEVDLAGNRQGMTIAEFGEPGGPGMGGCPNGPLASGPPGPTSVRAVNVPGGVKLSWTPATAIPGTPAITGYQATAVGESTNAAGEQSAFQKRIPGQAATGTTITGLTATEKYDIEVVSISSVGQTYPAAHAIPETDTVDPTVFAAPGGGEFAVAQNVTLTANEAGADIYYTTDETPPVTEEVTGPTARRYTGPIAITADTVLRFAAFDLANNVSEIGEESYTITDTPVPAAPVFTTPSTGAGSVTLNWQAGDATVSAYTVQAYEGAGAPFGAPVTVTGTPPATTATVPGLTGDVPYFFTVTATNPNGTSSESAKLGPITPLGAVVANAGPDQTVTRKTTATTVNLTGAGSIATGATYQWQQLGTDKITPIGATDPDMVTLLAPTSLNASFSLPVYKFPMTNKALTFQLTVTTTDGTKSDTVLVTPKADTVAIGTAKWKAGDFRVTGSGTVVGGLITIHKGSLSGPVLGTAALTAAAPPATGAVFDARVRVTTPDLGTNPGLIWIESSLGGTAGPFTVSS